MALRDWKKVRRYSNVWGSEKQHKLISIEGITDYDKHLYEGKGDIGVKVSSTHWPLSTLERKRFLTKSQALKFAKSYMLNH